MRVQGPTTVSTSSVRRSKASTSSGSFSVDSSSESERAEPVTATQPLTSLDTLVSLQGATDDRDTRKRAVKRGGDMLDMLDGIRFDLLDGVVPAKKLDALLKMVRLQRDRIEDPRLSHLLDEIELRAQVELAKYGSTR